MLSLESKVHVEGVSGARVLDFLLRCEDAAYRRWWPGTHLRCHTVRHESEALGNVIMMDEWVGRRRLRLEGVVTDWDPARRMTLQFQLGGLRLPGWLIIECDDDATGTTVKHTVRAGFEGGVGQKLVEPLVRGLFFTGEFPLALDAHVKEEFPRLAALLSAPAAA